MRASESRLGQHKYITSGSRPSGSLARSHAAASHRPAVPERQHAPHRTIHDICAMEFVAPARTSYGGPNDGLPLDITAMIVSYVPRPPRGVRTR